MTAPVGQTNEAQKTLRRVALRYRGGKARDAWWIIAHLPQCECYVEPFMGAASVLLQREPADFEVLNDLDGAVVNFFRVLREQPSELMRLITLTPYSRQEYRLCRDSCPDNPLEWARRVYVWAWQGRGRALERNGGWRFQTSWNGWNAHVLRQFRDVSHLDWIADRLTRVQIEQGEALDVIGRYDRPQTLFLCDPPYLPEVRQGSGTLYRCEMDVADHVALAEKLRGIRGMAVVCGYPHPLYDELYTRHGWRLETKASYGEAQKATVEAVWINPAAQAALAAEQAQGSFLQEAT